MNTKTKTSREHILARLLEITNLPSFPNIVVKLSQLLQDSETSTEEIVEVIKLDPVISSNILHLANTVAFNHSSRVSSIDEAVIRIGFRNVKDVVLSISIIRSFPSTGHMDYGKFWNHSLSVAFATQVIERHSKASGQSGDLYMAGLLHDLGILVLDQFFSDVYVPVLAKAKEEERPLHEIERYMLGIESSEITAHLLERWRLPEPVIEAVRYQDRPHLAPATGRRMAKILHIANYACENQGINNGVESFPVRFSNSAWFELGLKVDEVEDIIEKVNEQTSKAKTLFQVASKGDSDDDDAAEEGGDVSKEKSVAY